MRGQLKTVWKLVNFDESNDAQNLRMHSNMFAHERTNKLLLCLKNMTVCFSCREKCVQKNCTNQQTELLDMTRMCGKYYLFYLFSRNLISRKWNNIFWEAYIFHDLAIEILKRKPELHSYNKLMLNCLK